MYVAFSEYINFSGDFSVWIWKKRSTYVTDLGVDPCICIISFILNQFVSIVDIATEHVYQAMWCRYNLFLINQQPL